MHTPYVGITGFMSRDEVIPVLNACASSHRLVKVGVLASQRTLFFGEQNKWPERYPTIHKVKQIFHNHSCALNLVHYHTEDMDTLLGQMLDITEFMGPLFHGFQLNVVWPSPQMLEQYRRRCSNMKIVLQVGGEAFEQIGNSPLSLAQKVADEYHGLIDYLLLDLSGGHGEPFNTVRTRSYLEALRWQGVERFAGLGAAGGLSPTTLNLVEPLVKDFPELSIDTEICLRDKDVAQKYVNSAMQMFAT